MSHKSQNYCHLRVRESWGFKRWREMKNPPGKSIHLDLDDKYMGVFACKIGIFYLCLKSIKDKKV